MIRNVKLVISLFVTLAVLLAFGMFTTVDNTKAEESDREGYMMIDWEPTPNAYWYSSHKEINTELVTKENSTASNLAYFIGSKMFTKEDIPVGSIIEIDEGYQYRPDGWVDLERQPGSARPGNVTENEVVVDEDWWDDYQYRGFNIAIEGGKEDVTENWEEVASHFRIYVPLEDEADDGDTNNGENDGKDENDDSEDVGDGEDEDAEDDEDANDDSYIEIDWEPTPNAYWHSTNTGIGAQLSTPENSTSTNHKYFIGSKLFSRDDLPVGSIIQIDEGYQYRPDGYLDITPPQPGVSRPANVTENEIVVDEDWWGDYQYRGFNIAVEGGKEDIRENWEEVASHFRIYVPSDSENGDGNNGEGGNDNEDEDNDGNNNDGNNGDPIKLLAIGNSFSEDALTYLNAMARADGLDIEVSILYIGGSALSAHWTNASQNKPVYKLIEYKDGKIDSSKDATIESVLESDDWDYVSLQQASHFSGIPSTYNPYLSNLEGYVKTRVSDAEILIHQTWAYESGSDHYGFTRFEGDPNVMFNQVSEAYKIAAKNLGDVKVIPSGLAMQNARTNELFDPSEGGISLFRDGYHANRVHGRYLLASVWYEALTDNLVSESAYKPAGVSDEELAVLKDEAHKAVIEYTSAPAELDLKEDLNGLLWYEGEDYYAKRPSNNDPVAELTPGERIDIPVDDLDLFGNGKYEVGLLAAGSGSTYEIEVNDEPIGTLNRDASGFAMKDVTMTYLDDTEVTLKEGDIVSIIAPEDGKYESGWIDAVVLKNISLNPPEPNEPEEPEEPSEPEDSEGDTNDSEDTNKPGTPEESDDSEGPEDSGEKNGPDQSDEEEDRESATGTSDESGNDKLPITATNFYGLLAIGGALLFIGMIIYFYSRRKKSVN